MNHTWKRQPDKEIFSGTMGKVWKCTVCGCNKYLGNYKFATPHYERSGRHSEDWFECIDIEAENLKTID